MLTSLRIRNFKAWQDTGKVRLAPLTLIFGANSVGKSSLGQWLQVLKQSVQSDGSKGALDFGNPDSLLQLGTFNDCIHDHDRRRELGFNLQWSLPTPLTLGTDPVGKLLQGNTLALEVALSGTPDARAQLRSQYYRLLAEQRQVLATTGARLPRAGWQLHCEQLLSLPAPAQRPHLQAPTLFHQMPTGLRSLFANSELLDALPLQTAALLEATHISGRCVNRPCATITGRTSLSPMSATRESWRWPRCWLPPQLSAVSVAALANAPNPSPPSSRSGCANSV
jgi:hypothetical protein